MVDEVDGARPPQRGIPTKDMDARTAVDKNPFEKVDEKMGKFTYSIFVLIFDIGVGPQVFTGRCVVSFRTFKFPLEMVSISSFGLLLLNSKNRFQLYLVKLARPMARATKRATLRVDRIRAS